MTESTERDCFQRLVQRLEPQSKLVRSWELKGGVSAQVTALEIEQLDGKRKKMVVQPARCGRHFTESPCGGR